MKAATSCRSHRDSHAWIRLHFDWESWKAHTCFILKHNTLLEWEPDKLSACQAFCSSFKALIMYMASCSHLIEKQGIWFKSLTFWCQRWDLVAWRDTAGVHLSYWRKDSLTINSYSKWSFLSHGLCLYKKSGHWMVWWIKNMWSVSPDLNPAKHLLISVLVVSTIITKRPNQGTSVVRLVFTSSFDLQKRK